MRRQARVTTRDYLGAVVAYLADPKAAKAEQPGVMAEHVAGQALAQLTNQAAEMAQNGQRVVGQPRVVSSVVTARTLTPPSMTVSVCLDNSQVRILDRAGKELTDSSAQPTRNILTVAQRSGTWVVTDQTFPDNPNC